MCNSALATPGRIHLCLSVVRYATRDASNTPSLRWGLASSMLAKLAAPLLAPGGGGGAVPMVKVFKNPPSGNELRLPTTPATPVVMIGPGTGVAPFRAFVQERKVRATPPRVHLYALPKPPPDPLTLHSSRPPPQVRWPRSQLGPTHLYVGCQPEVDFLYADELQTMSLSGALQLHTAFSRAGDPAEAGWWRGVRVGVTYVQDVLEERKAEVAGLLYDANAHLYVCGDGKAMATDVHGALLRITADPSACRRRRRRRDSRSSQPRVGTPGRSGTDRGKTRVGRCDALMAHTFHPAWAGEIKKISTGTRQK